MRATHRRQPNQHTPHPCRTCRAAPPIRAHAAPQTRKIPGFAHTQNPKSVKSGKNGNALTSYSYIPHILHIPYHATPAANSPRQLPPRAIQC